MQISMLKKAFLKALENSDIKVVSFDIFDTLVFRKCEDPKRVFDLVGKKKKILSSFESSESFKNYRINAEKKARVKSKFEEINVEEIYKQLPLSKKKQKEFLNEELLSEDEMIVVNEELKEWIDIAFEMGKKIILISDMYLSKNHIEKLVLSKLSNKDKISQVFMSSEAKKKKSTSKLFIYVKDEMKVEFKQILHIGDNETSDVLVPQSLGICTLYYGYSNDEKQSFLHEHAFFKHQNYKALHVRKLSILQNPFEDEFKNFYFFLASSIFAPLLWEFSHFLASLMKTQKINSLLFLAREGVMFEKYFKNLYPHIKTNILYASRASTLFLDLNGIGDVNLVNYRALKIKEVYKSFFLTLKNDTIKAYEDMLLDKANDIFIENQSLFDIIAKDIKAREKEILKKYKKQKKLLKEYIEDKNISKHVALVDFGGRGTVNKRLIRHFLNKKRDKSILFYKYPSLAKDDSKILEFGFLKDYENHLSASNTLKETPGIAEILLNLDEKTTLCYEKKGKKVKALLHLPRCNEKEMEKIKESFVCGLDTFFNNAKLYKLKAKSFDRDFLSNILSRLISYPTTKEVEMISSLVQDEGKATDFTYKLIDSSHEEKIKSDGLLNSYAIFLENPSHYKYLVPWVSGTITKLKPNFFDVFFPRYININYIYIESLIKKLNEKKIKKVNIYAAGNFFKQLLPALKENGINIDKIADKRAEIKPFEVQNLKVITLKELLQTSQTKVILIASGAFVKDIEKYIKKVSDELKKDVEVVGV